MANLDPRRLIVLLLASLTLSIFPHSRIWGQGLDPEDAKVIFGDAHVLHYQPFSFELTDAGVDSLQYLGKQLMLLPGMLTHTVLVVEIRTCSQELLVKPNLDFFRAKKLIAELERMVGFPPRKCVVSVLGELDLGPECEGGSEATLYLVEDWRNPKE
ncbi:hypothetical protein [Pontibacter sp. G13]|uniref:hypothetical protein n=1 Tax=Pontibacter sp. G13 TaxID=3074898 RepID=UPI00288A58D8|nr:hypothetical protein [Pontibacter sp. G13]WNJ20750.1 hypothetical protein RJD25_09730 [Pontibacter sp. G13]